MAIREVDLKNTLLGPNAVEAQLHQAVTVCWMSLPANDRSVARLIEEFTRISDRVIRNIRDDATSQAAE